MQRTGAGTAPGWLALPGARTLLSARFRIAVGLTLTCLAVGLMGFYIGRRVGDPYGQFGIDFIVYQFAATDLAAGSSPYAPSMLAGPVAAQGELLYKYAPPFAQSLVPLAGLPLALGTAVWGLLQASLCLAAVWLAGSLGGARAGLERAVWSVAAVALYLPIWDSIWKGNVSAVQAMQSTLLLAGGAVGGASLASAILLKTSPLALLPAAVAMGGRLLKVCIVVICVTVAVSVAIAPEAWLDFLRIQPNLLTGTAVFPTNLAPASMAAVVLPDLPSLAAVLRLATLCGGIGCVVAAVALARRPGGWPAAVMLGTTAMLIIPGAAWYHYLAALLPFAAFSWHRATARQRLIITGGGAAVSLGMAGLPMAVVGATLLVGQSLAVVWPRHQAPT